MKKWKKIVFAAVILIFVCVGSALASQSTTDESRVYDMADLLEDREEAELTAEIKALQKKMDMGVAIVTTEENRGSAKDFADDFYEQYEIGFGKNHDGALLLIDMENGELWISTEGKMVRYLTDSRIDAILDDIIEYAYNGQFFQASSRFLEDLEICYDNGIASDQYNHDVETGKKDRYKSIEWYECLIAFAVSSVTAGIAVLAVVREYGMKDDSGRMSANFNLSYRNDSAFTRNHLLADVLLGSYTTRTVIRASNPRPGGGGGGGPRPGGNRGFSGGGRSSTHRSSSGRSHGGGGRKFR